MYARKRGELGERGTLLYIYGVGFPQKYLYRKNKKIGGNPTPPTPFCNISHTAYTFLYYILIARCWLLFIPYHF